MPWWLTVVAIFLLTRLALWGLGAHLSQTFPLEHRILNGQIAPGRPLVDPWLRWDSLYYLDIANRGYEYTPGERSNAAFFPAYPALIRVCSFLTGDFPLSALLVSHACCLLALGFLYRLCLLEGADDAAARRTLLYLCLFPSGFVFSVGYSESLFLFTSVAAFYAMRRRRWDWAAGLAIWSAATRPTGLLVGFAILQEWMSLQGWTLRSIFRPEAWWGLWRGLRSQAAVACMLVLPPLGLLTVLAYQSTVLGNPVAFLQVQGSWGRGQGNLLTALEMAYQGLAGAHYAPSFFPIDLPFNLLSLCGGLGLSIAVWRRWGETYGVYCLLQFLIPASTGSLMSMTRFALLAFPAFMLLGEWGRRRLLDRLLLGSFCSFQVVLLCMWTNWYFIL